VARHNVQKFNSDGDFLGSWGEFGHGEGELWTPKAIQSDHAGRIYVAEEGTNRIQVFSYNIGLILNLDAIPETYTVSSPVVTGSVDSEDGTVTSVEFQVGGTSGIWVACTSVDGTFDETDEEFTCDLPELADGSNTVYFRTTNSFGSSVTEEITIRVNTTGLVETGQEIKYFWIVFVVSIGLIMILRNKLKKIN